MEILITSKTHKGKLACVGGIALNDNRFVRLLTIEGWDQYASTDLNIGDVWNIQYLNLHDLDPPHIEDIAICNRTYLRNIDDISSYIRNCGVTIYRGSPVEIFGGRLGWTGNGSGYIGNRLNLPRNSVGFWISDKDLTIDSDGKHYIYPTTNESLKAKRIPYVGFETAIQVIPSGTLMRISLARWWKPDNSDVNERCYLQLSGWYGLQSLERNNIDGFKRYDLPF